MGKTCCVTGHRDIPSEQLDHVETELRDLIRRSIIAGYDTFLSGFAAGTDLLFARLVLELQEECPVQLEAALPYTGWLHRRDQGYQELLAMCSAVHIVSEQYSSGCFFARNRYLVDHSDAVIAVYDGRQGGGTFYTVRYARAVGRKIAFVHIIP